MNDVIFYDFDFNKIADFPQFTSLNFEIKYLGYGTAEVHYPLKQYEIITMLEENPYLFFKAEENSAIVTGWKIGEDIAIYGRTPEWLLTKRGVEPVSLVGALPETIVNQAVLSAAGDFITIGDLKGIGTAMDYSATGVKALYDVVCEVLSSQDLGLRIYPDIELKSFVLEMYEGSDSLCILSMSNRTAYEMQYVVDMQDKVDGCGWYEQRYEDRGSWNAQKNEPGISNNLPENAYSFYHITSDSYNSSGSRIERFGLWCRKDTYLYSDNSEGIWKISDTRPSTIWIYLGESKQSGAKKWEAVLSGTKTKQEALAEILLKKTCETTETETKDVELGTDYRLGDIVRVQIEVEEFKKTEKKRVTAVNIYNDVNGAGVIPILSSEEE